MQSLNHFNCRKHYDHLECQHDARLGFNPVDCFNAQQQQQVTGTSIFLENLIDLSHSLAKIMTLCGIHECKAKTAIDIITHSFLNYELVCYRLDAKPAKRLRKEDIFHELGKKCLMNRLEAHLCYNIIKRAFKAFYYSPPGDEQMERTKQNDRHSFSEECVYVHAAKKTAEYYGQFEGLSPVEQEGIQTKILAIYKKFYYRWQSRKAKPQQEHCNCCLCIKSRQHLIYTTTPTKKPHTCHCCCKKKKSRKVLQDVKVVAKCSACCRSYKFCCCTKYQFDLNWIGSIWCWPHMKHYCKENIEKEPLEL